MLYLPRVDHVIVFSPLQSQDISITLKPLTRSELFAASDSEIISDNFQMRCYC